MGFSGKERDQESGNDYFGARYYASTLGRFMRPDWAAKAEPVPYAKLDDPQSLDLYDYMRNDPLGGTDATGHCPPCGEDLVVDAVDELATHPALLSKVAGILESASSGAVSISEDAGKVTLGDVGVVALILLSPQQAGGDPAERKYEQEVEKHEEPQAAAAAGGRRGRGGKHGRLRGIANDDRAPSADRGWIKSEINQMKRGNRRRIRVPPGKNLAHRRGKEARNGYDYSHSDLQDIDLHQTQHRLENQH